MGGIFFFFFSFFLIGSNNRYHSYFLPKPNMVSIGMRETYFYVFERHKTKADDYVQNTDTAAMFYFFSYSQPCVISFYVIQITPGIEDARVYQFDLCILHDLTPKTEEDRARAPRIISTVRKQLSLPFPP